jgi:hypothetical protein
MNKLSRFTSNGFKLVVMALAISGAGSAMAAPTPATADSTTTVITPIIISKDVDLAFGNIATSASPGTVTLTPGGTATANAGASLMTGVTPAAAKFTVTGEVGKTFAVTVSGTALTIQGGGSESMAFTPVSDFTASGIVTGNLSGATGSLATGTQSIFVGGVLSVAANQKPGNYKGSVTASVEYN